MTEQVNWIETPSQSPLPGKPTWDDSTSQRSPIAHINVCCCCCRLLGSVTADSSWLWTGASKAPLSVEFPKQEYWSGLSFIHNSKNGPKQIYHLVMHSQKNWCFWTVVLEKTLESPLDCKDIQPVYPKRNQSWVFTGRTDVEAETPILRPPGAKSWLICKDPDAGKDWGQEEKGTTEDEMVGWHHRLNGHEFG